MPFIGRDLAHIWWSRIILKKIKSSYLVLTGHSFLAAWTIPMVSLRSAKLQDVVVHKMERQTQNEDIEGKPKSQPYTGFTKVAQEFVTSSCVCLSVYAGGVDGWKLWRLILLSHQFHTNITLPDLHQYKQEESQVQCSGDGVLLIRITDLTCHSPIHSILHLYTRAY